MKTTNSLDANTVCEHCGLPAHGARFCCGGCETAFKIIHESGLASFYNEAEKPYRQVAETRIDTFEAFDHPSFLESYTLKHGSTRSAEFRVSGLHCSACIWLLEKLPRLCAPCVEARVHYGKSTILIHWKDEPQALSQILTQLARLGYPTAPFQGEGSQNLREDWLRNGVTGALAMANMHLGLYFLGAWGEGMDDFHAYLFGFVSALLTIPVITYGGKSFFLNAFHGLKLKQVHTDVLIALALLIGFAYSLVETFQAGIDVYYDSISMIVFLLLMGRSLIRVTTNRLSQPLSWTAKKLTEGGLVTLPISGIKIGDRIQLQRGDVVPVDLKLIDEEAWIDLSVATGESLPSKILGGQTIVQGAINESPTLLGEVLSESKDSSYSKLTQKLNEPIPTFTSSTLEQVFSVTVILVAALTFLFMGMDSIDRVVGILIVACPCALALSRPLVLDALRRAAFKNGIALFRLDRVLRAPQLRRIVFDKTGTLTTGRLEVQRIEEIAKLPMPREKLNDLLYALSKQSSHPLSRAIALYLNHLGVQEAGLKQPITETVGQGVRLETEGGELEIGRDESHVGRPTSLVRFNNRPILRIFYLDRAREAAADTINRLKRKGFATALFSGDRKASVDAFLKEAQISFDETRADLSPDQKVQSIDSDSIMVGDGLNDAEALSRSGFGIGISGSAESNLRAADAYLLNGDLSRIENILDATTRARTRIHLNYGVSLIYNLITILLVLNGSIGPILCAIFMPLSSVSVVILSNLRNYFTQRTAV